MTVNLLEAPMHAVLAYTLFRALTHGSDIIKNEISSSGINGIESHGKHTRATKHVKKLKICSSIFSHVR